MAYKDGILGEERRACVRAAREYAQAHTPARVLHEVPGATEL